MIQLGAILLIDDNKHDNFFHKRVIKKAGIEATIIDFQYADEALQYLQEQSSAQVDMILLDVNMPRMNGFDFLEAYEKLPEVSKAKVIIIMLTTSLNPMDKIRADSYPAVKGYCNKPLTEDSFKEILMEHFSLG